MLLQVTTALASLRLQLPQLSQGQLVILVWYPWTQTDIQSLGLQTCMRCALVTLTAGTRQRPARLNKVTCGFSRVKGSDQTGIHGLYQPTQLT